MMPIFIASSFNVSCSSPIIAEIEAFYNVVSPYRYGSTILIPKVTGTYPASERIDVGSEAT
jgi:hypothetical protein